MDITQLRFRISYFHFHRDILHILSEQYDIITKICKNALVNFCHSTHFNRPLLYDTIIFYIELICHYHVCSALCRKVAMSTEIDRLSGLNHTTKLHSAGDYAEVE